MMTSNQLRRIAPEALFVASGLSQNVGAVVAVAAFYSLAPQGVAWWRVFGAGLLLVVMRRSWRREWTRPALLLTAAFGTVLAFMNLCFYLAIHRLPLGNVVAIEFLGPITVVALTARSRRNWLGLLVVGGGVIILADVELSDSPLGVLFALLGGGFWALYIVLGDRVANKGAALDGLGVGMLFGAVAILPFAGAAAYRGVIVPAAVGLAVGAGVLSNMIPYSLDQLIMQRIPSSRFALLLALLPVVATVTGIVALAQIPGSAEVVGIGLVVAGILISERPAETSRVSK